jgi:hypothetical protein
MPGRFRAVVPPTQVPEALEQRRWMARDEMKVAAERFLQEFQYSSQGAICRHLVYRLREIYQQVKHKARLRLGLEEG